jgi:hypothetical protein
MKDKTRRIFDDQPHGGIMFPGANWVVSAWDCENVARWFRTGVPLGRIPTIIRDLMLAGFCLLFALGCGATELPSPEVQARASELSALLTSTKTVETKSDEILKVVESNTNALAAIKAKVDALQVVSNPNGKDGDPASAPESPAKANTQQALLNVATPGTSSRVASDGTVLRWNVDGNWNPTILETSRHLGADHGINTNGMTHQEMADIHASIHDGKPVAMKSETVRYVSRGTYQVGFGSSCPGGVCPRVSSTRQVVRRRR